MKKFLIFLFIFITTMLTSIANESNALPTELGIVKSVEYIDSNNSLNSTVQRAEIKILDGKNKNKYILLDNIMTDNPHYDIKLKKNSKKWTWVDMILQQNFCGYNLSYQFMKII